MLLLQASSSSSRMFSRQKGGHSVHFATRSIHASGRNTHNYTGRSDDNDEALLKIGKSTERIIADMESFCSYNKKKPFMPANMYAKNVSLKIQNGPSDVILSCQGRVKYRLAHRILHSLLPFCYSVCYEHLCSTVYPLAPRQNACKQQPPSSSISKAPVELKIKWVLRGCHHPPFFLYQPPENKNNSNRSKKSTSFFGRSASYSNEEVLLEAYCVFVFDRESGRIVSHVVDWVAAVPPVDLQLELDLVQPYWLGQRRVPDTVAVVPVSSPPSSSPSSQTLSSPASSLSSPYRYRSIILSSRIYACSRE